jgi:hypothetical protein
MRTSLPVSSASVSVAVTLFLSLGLERPLAHAQSAFRSPVMRMGIVHGHGQVRGQRDGDRNFWVWRSQDRRNRNGWFWTRDGSDGPGFWSSPYGFAGPAVGGAPLVVVGTPALNLDPNATAESFYRRPEGGCVIHRLMYDHAGKYVGERQTPEC